MALFNSFPSQSHLALPLQYQLPAFGASLQPPH